MSGRDELSRNGGDRSPGRDGRPRPPQTDDAAPTGASRRWIRRIPRLAAALGTVLLVLYGGAALLFSTLVEPAELARWLEPRASAALNRPVEVGGVRVRVFPRLAIQVDSVEIRDPPAFGQSHLARATSVELRVSILPLLRRRIAVTQVVIREPDVQLLVEPDGTTNFGDFLPASRELSSTGAPAAGGGLSFRVRELRVEGGEVRYRDASSGRSVLLRSADLSGDLGRRPDGRWEMRPELEADSVRIAGVWDREVSLDRVRSRLELRSGPRFRWVVVRDGTLGAAALEANLSGRIDGVRDTVRRIDLRASVPGVDLRDVLSLLPESSRDRIPGEVEGSVTGSLAVRGEAGPGRTPDVSGRLSVDRASLTLPGMPTVLEEGSLRAELRADTVRLERAGGTLFGGEVRLSGHVSLDSGRPFRAHLEAEPAVSRLLELGAAARLTGGGSLSLRLDVTGAVDRLHASRLSGQVELRGVRIVRRREEAESPPLELEIPEGSVQLRGREARWTSLPLILGPDRLLFTGTLTGLLDSPGTPGNRLDPPGASGNRRGPVRPLFRGTLQSARFDLDRIFPPETDAPSYGRLAFGRMGGRPVAGRTPDEWAGERGLALVGSVPVEGRLALRADTLSFRDLLLTDVDAQLKLGRDVLELRPASASLWEGSVETRFTLGIGGEATQPFLFQLETDSVEAEHLLDRFTPLSRLATGRLDLEMDLAGRMDTLLLPVPPTLVGRGRFSLGRGRLRQNAVSRALGRFFDLTALDSLEDVRWNGRFSLTGREVRLDSASLDSSAADFTLAGTVGYGGAVDLAIQMEYPVSRLSELSLGDGRLSGETLEVLLESVREDGETMVPLGVRVTGRPPGLRVSLEAGALTERLATGARRAARDSLVRVLEEGRGEIRARSTRLLRRLLGATDSLPPAPPDTTGTDTAAATGEDTTAVPEDSAGVPEDGAANSGS